MQSSSRRTLTRATHVTAEFLASGCAVLTLILSSCSSISSSFLEPQESGQEELPLPYSIVCVVHGDGDYLYHDSSGNQHRADEDALAGAVIVAEQNAQAEVFIFHERPSKRLFFFFPLPDGEFLYYRSGRLLATESYWRDGGQTRFDPEAWLYQKYRHGLCAEEQASPLRLFLYFGHEIPEVARPGYDDSYPDWTFSVDDLAEALNHMTDDSAKFELVVLSTCFGGTPYTIASLSPYARTIIASPDNLHLSYFDLHPLERLDVGLSDRDVPGFAKRFAQHAFDKLTREIQTAVTISVYDVPRVQAFLRSVDSVYGRALRTLKGTASTATDEYCDCAEDAEYALPGMSDGVDVFYRPPRFGRAKHKLTHSGWGCLGWREKRTTQLDFGSGDSRWIGYRPLR